MYFLWEIKKTTCFFNGNEQEKAHNARSKDVNITLQKRFYIIYDISSRIPYAAWITNEQFISNLLYYIQEKILQICCIYERSSLSGIYSIMFRDTLVITRDSWLSQRHMLYIKNSFSGNETDRILIYNFAFARCVFHLFLHNSDLAIHSAQATSDKSLNHVGRFSFLNRRHSRNEVNRLKSGNQ